MQDINPAAASHEKGAVEEIETDLCIIGAGSGGLTVAASAAMFGRRVVLIEKHKLGGERLHYGSVPSKALAAAARRAQAMRTAQKFGISPAEPMVTMRGVNDHIRGVIAALAPNYSVERYAGLGVQVIRAAGRFVDKHTVAAGDYRIKARRFVIATGSSPLIPAIPGLDSVPYFTNETIIDNADRLPHLIVLGAQTTGLELAQSYRRLGSKVTVLDSGKALADCDPELAAVLLKALRAEGIEIHERARVDRIEGKAGQVTVHATSEGGSGTIDGTHLLVAVGRAPNTADLGLEAAGVRFGTGGIRVGRRLVTSNRRVFAIGDVIGGPPFTHAANHQAELVVRRALFRFAPWADKRLVPWVTFTQPEIASVGLTEEQAISRKYKINVLRWPFHENDRAQAERCPDGHVKVITDRSGRILGAGIVSEQAGELIQIWSLAVAQKMKISSLTGWVAPYPTLSEINKRVANRYYAAAAGNTLIRKIIGFLTRFG
jgi:pyruvate/2-oxoglutarate dehydrogenase complex dihydrolipoamide dehydrogenase (E3) component